MRSHFLRTSALLALLVLGLPPMTMAQTGQSAIVGVARDSSGGILPGVTVEAASPALIEKIRSAVTDTNGQYRVVDLRPGTYIVTFSLTGFSTVKREGLVLEADFTATVNAEMRVGALEETITVTGESPVVDTRSTQRRDVINREALEALPTGRNYQTVGGTLPAVSMGRPDVGGSTTMQQGSLTAYGSLARDTTIDIAGMSATTGFSTGGVLGLYLNDNSYQEAVYQVAGANADVSVGGVRVNLIPKEGGNQFKAQFLGLYAGSNMASSNLSDDLRSRGLTTPSKLAKLYDWNAEFGGPILRNKLWFYAGVRFWAVNNFIPNALNPDGSLAIDDNRLKGFTNRVTWQVTAKNKILGVYDRLPKYRGHRELELGGVSPEASVIQTTPGGALLQQLKWTSTVSNKLLVESGWARNFFYFRLAYQPEVPIATCFTRFTDCAPGTGYGGVTHQDLLRGTRTVAATVDIKQPLYKDQLSGAISYVTGTHELKFGTQLTLGHQEINRTRNGDLIQRYRNGVPDSVEVSNTPTQARQDISDLGIYVQDSWTINNRLTLNPGLRFERLYGRIPASSAPAGRFVPARQFDEIKGLPDWNTWSPRFGVAFDLFGNGKTALKGSIGKYMQSDSVGYPETYDPMVFSTDIRTWRDINGDDIAQENELGPSTNANFGTRRNRNPAPDVKRPFNLLYNTGVQHELRPGLAVSINYFRRTYHDLFWTNNLAVNVNADYTLLSVADPRGNGQTLPVYNLNAGKLGLVNELDTNSENNTQTFNGIDFGVNARLHKLTFTAGTSTGRVTTRNCDVPDPNLRRFCDSTEYNVPFLTAFKFSGIYTLPYDVRLSAVFQTVPGSERAIQYLVNRAVVPNLTQAQVAVRLNEPGTEYNDRINQLDMSVAKTFRAQGFRILPKLDIFNAFNGAPIVTQVNTFGTSVGRPLTVNVGRIVRFGLQVDF